MASIIWRTGHNLSVSVIFRGCLANLVVTEGIEPRTSALQTPIDNN